MPTNTKSPSEEAQNYLLEQSLALLESRAPAFCPSWGKAIQPRWPSHVKEMKVHLERARIGAEKGPTAKIRKAMASHAEKLERWVTEPPPVPDSWKVKLSYKIGEVFSKTKRARGSREESSEVLGQADLTAIFTLPELSELHVPGSVTVPNEFLPENLREKDSWQLRMLSRRTSSEEQWHIDTYNESPYSLQYVHKVYRFVLAPSPANYQKVLKAVRLIETWATSDYVTAADDVRFGVITDDRKLHDIVNGQGDVALYIKPSSTDES